MGAEHTSFYSSIEWATGDETRDQVEAASGLIKWRQMAGTSHDHLLQIERLARVARNSTTWVHGVVPQLSSCGVKFVRARPLHRLQVTLGKRRAANQIQSTIVNEHIQLGLEQILEPRQLREHDIAWGKFEVKHKNVLENIELEVHTRTPQRELDQNIAVIVRKRANTNRRAHRRRRDVCRVVVERGRHFSGNIVIIHAARYIGEPGAARRRVAIEERCKFC